MSHQLWHEASFWSIYTYYKKGVPRESILTLILKEFMIRQIVVLFVCLFVCLCLSSFSIFFIITGEELQILTNAQLSWQLSSEGSLACHTYCDMSQPFIMFIFEDPWHSHLLPNVCQWSCHYQFLLLRSVAARIQEHPFETFRLLGERSNRLRHRRGHRIV